MRDDKRAVQRRSVMRGLLGLSAVAATEGVATLGAWAQQPAASPKPGERKQAAVPKWLTLPPTPDLPPTGLAATTAVNGTSLFHAQFGTGSTDVVLLHGGMGHSNYWGHQIAALALQYRVTVIDSRGHGRSPYKSGPLSYALLADDMAALFMHLAIKEAFLVGWSDGGIVAVLLALKHPELVKGIYTFGPVPR